jgi:hypothetical protein
MTVPARLSVSTLGARDLPALRDFYTGLGRPAATGSDDDWAGFPLGGVLLALYPAGALTAEAAPPHRPRRQAAGPVDPRRTDSPPARVESRAALRRPALQRRT